MRKLILLCIMAFIPFIIGCSASFPHGAIFTEVTLPIDAESGAIGKKVGTAECMCILGLVATGDCGINEAMRNGGITKVQHVDWSVRNVLGIVAEYQTIVYGE